MKNRFAITIFVIAILMSPLAAQMRGVTSGVGLTGRTGFVGHAGAVGSVHLHHAHSLGRGSILLPYPYYDSGFGYDSQEPAEPQVVVVPAAAPTQPVPPAHPLEPLLIEWQGDHFERMTLSQEAGASGPSRLDYSEKSSSLVAGRSIPGSSMPSSPSRARKVAAQPPRRELPPAVLVFRDG